MNGGKMKNIMLKKMIFGGLGAVCALAALTVSVLAWFYFPMTQYTMVYTDSVPDAEVKAELYRRDTGTFTEVNDENGDGKIALDFVSDSGEVIKPYFFLWAGDYTTNDTYRTLYKVTVNYSNADNAYPTYLDLYGKFTFDFVCYGDDGQPIDVRFMKLSYYAVPAGETDSFLTAEYEAFSDEAYASGDGYEVKFGRIESSGETDTDYSIVVYLLLETDVDTLNSSVELLADEYGLLDAEFSINTSFYFRTAPANTFANEETTLAP